MSLLHYPAVKYASNTIVFAIGLETPLPGKSRHAATSAWLRVPGTITIKRNSAQCGAVYEQWRVIAVRCVPSAQ